MLFHTTIQAFARLAAAGLLLGNFLSVDAQEFFLGSLRTLDHQVSGNVYLLSEKVIEVRDFTYDGTGPFAYFWADTNPTPSRGGRVLSDGLPSNNCATMVGDADLPLSEGTIQRVEFPGDSTIRDYLGGSFSVWCERFAANFGDLQLPDSLPEGSFAAVGPDLQCSDTPRDYPPIAVTPDGYNCEPLSEDYQVRWNINGNNIDVELVGRIPDDAYMSFGVSGRAGETFMINADVVVADIPTTGDTAARARDYYMDARAQCSGTGGVCADTVNGLTNDASNVSGEKDFGLTLIRYSRPLAATDSAEFDKSIPTTAGTDTFIAWALGPINTDTGNPFFHNLGYARADGNSVSLDFGRAVADNCEPLVFLGETAPPTETPPPPFRRPLIGDDETIIEAHIGPSGGPRGYTAITEGLTAWGVAWYMNGFLIPELVLRRGTKYTFRINGGNDPTQGAQFHPFYLTTSEVGGYAQLSPQERKLETPLAGIDITWTDADGGVTDYVPTAAGPICSYQTTSATPDAELLSFEEYFATLDSSCADDEWLTDQAAILEFTPDETTPDTIYYHCVTHFNLGFKIRVIDEDAPEATQEPTGAPTGEAVFDDFDELLLEGQLEGAVLLTKFNLADERAGGVDTVSVVLDVPVEAWAGWAISDNGGFMVGSEAVIGVPETGEVLKYNLNAQNPDGVVPMPDNQQTLIDTSIRQIDGRTLVSFTKIAVEPNEIPFDVAGDNTLLSAWGLGNNLGIHAKRASFSLSGEAIEVREKSLWKAHGFLAAFAWAALSPLAIICSIFRQYFPGEGLWFQLHRGFNSLVILFTIAAFVVGVLAINKETPSGADSNHFDREFADGHRTLGLVIFILAFGQALGGALRPHAPHAPAKSEEAPEESPEEANGKSSKPEATDDETPEKTIVRYAWEIGHRVIGLGLLGLCWYQVQLGVKTYADFFNDGDADTMLAALWAIIGSLGGIMLIGYVMKIITAVSS